MKVYITKHALTRGIIEIHAKIFGSTTVKDRGLFGAYYQGNDWHKDLNSAKARAEKMRVKKIASLKKSIAKLESMKF